MRDDPRLGTDEPATALGTGEPLPFDGSLERDEDAAEAWALLSTLPSPTQGRVRDLNRRVVEALDTWPPEARATWWLRARIAAAVAVAVGIGVIWSALS